MLFFFSFVLIDANGSWKNVNTNTTVTFVSNVGAEGISILKQVIANSNKVRRINIIVTVRVLLFIDGSNDDGHQRILKS